MRFLCRGFSESGKCWGPMGIEAIDEESAAHQYAVAVFDLFGIVIKRVEINGNRYAIGYSLEFFVRPAGVAVHV